MKVSIDVGSGFTKYKTEDIEGNIPSLVAIQNQSSFLEDQEEAVSFNGQSFLVGDSAIRLGDASTRSNTLSTEWAGSEGWMALLYSALARVNANGEIDLIVGLPQAIFTTKNKSLIEKLKGSHVFKVNDKQFNVIIKPITIPQAAGALFYKAEQDDDLLDDVVGMIDIGTYTTGFNVLERSRLNHNKSGGCEVGVQQLLKQVQLFLKETYQYEEDIAVIPEIIMKGQIRYRNEYIDISERISELTLKVSTPIVDAVNTAWRGGNQLSIFVAGGGAPYFLEAIQTKMPHATLVEDGFYAVTRGMYTYLEQVTD